jgi:hypothetical protein
VKKNTIPCLKASPVDTYENETLEQAAKNALKQIHTQNYAQEMIARGIKSVMPIAIVFDGKMVDVQTA